MKIIITEEEKLRIKKLYESEKDINMSSLEQKISIFDISDCDVVRDDFIFESTLANKQNNEDLFVDRCTTIKTLLEAATKISLTSGQWRALDYELRYLMTQLCLNIQIMRTIKEKKWKIGKDYFTNSYNASLGIEDHLNKDNLSNFILFLNTFREKYNQM